MAHPFQTLEQALRAGVQGQVIHVAPGDYSEQVQIDHEVADYMRDPDEYLGLAAFYQTKRDFFLEGIRGSRFRVLPSRGTFFQNLAYDAISNEKDTDLAVRLTKEKGVASIPLSVFYHDGHCDRVLRFCFAKSEETLAKGAEILRTL